MAAFSTTRELKATYNSDNIKSSNLQMELLVSKLSQMGFSNYLKMEILNTYTLDNEQTKYEEKIEKVNTLIRIPLHLEKFFTYGFVLALDSFLFMPAMLPIRLFVIIKSILFFLCGKLSAIDTRKWQAAHVCDVIRVLLTVLCCYSLQRIDLSFLYHQIRGQNVLKVYILFNMLDVIDRLCATLGQDLIDTVFWAATGKSMSTNRQSRPSGGAIKVPLRFLSHFSLALVYIWIHSVIILLEATTLSVAFNSHNKSLLIIMMSNNFAELKGTVFKKFDKNNLYQLTCADVRERLHLLVLLLVVSVRNLRELNWDVVYFGQLLPELLLVLVAEVIVDWVKHCFIAKFNEIPADVYSEYRLSLAIDMVMSKRKEAVSEHCDVVARKMGQNPIPLICVLFKTFDQTLFSNFWSSFASLTVIIPVSFIIKTLTSMYILKQSCKIVKEHCDVQSNLSKSANSSNHSPTTADKSGQPKLSLQDQSMSKSEQYFRISRTSLSMDISNAVPPSTVPEKPIISASLEKLNQSEAGQAPLFTENSTVDLSAYHIQTEKDACLILNAAANSETKDPSSSTVSPADEISANTVSFRGATGDHLNKFPITVLQNVEIIEASQSDDEIVRNNSKLLLHDKAD